MKLTTNRMIATFAEGATIYPVGNNKTLAESLDFAWTSVYTGMSDAESALAWLKANVVGFTPVTDVHQDSPAWLESAADVPHNRDEKHNDDCAPSARWTVSDQYKLKVGERGVVLGSFLSEAEASQFITTLIDYQSGRYSLDGPTDEAD